MPEHHTIYPLEPLVRCWQNYQQAIKEELAKGADYDGDRVQASGLAFAHHWNQNKYLLCGMFDIEPDPQAKPSKNQPERWVWSYGIKQLVMSALLARG